MKADLLRIAGFAGIAAVAAIRSMVSIEPNLWFADVDPARDQMPLLSLGAAGSHALDLVLLLSAALAILGEVVARRGVHWGLVFLALVPVPVAAMHAHTGIIPENGFRTDTWIAAMFAAVALAHLGRDRRFRAAALGVFLGVIALLAVRGFVQVLVEHPATVAFYEETREAFLADRGWLPDSSAARTYERRLYQAEATGWFKLSNPFSTMMGVGLVGCGALAFAARRAQPSGNTLLLALAAVASVVLLVVNGGKGALLATIVAIAVLFVSLRAARLPSPRWALVLAACALGAVFARWLVGTRIGETSLLFRGFYLEAGVRMLGQGAGPLGLGAERVQEFFAASKPPNCPEDVKSLHSIFADWIIALGLSGVAWIAVIWRFFWPSREGDDGERGMAEASCEPDDGGEARARMLALATAAVAGVAGTAIAMRAEAPLVDGFWLATRVLGVFACVLVAGCAATAAMAAPPRALRAALFAVGVLVLVHAQIEMVAWLPGSCVLALLLIACAAELPAGRGQAETAAPTAAKADNAVLAPLLAVCVVVAAISMGASLWRSTTRATHLERAARMLAVVRDEPAKEFDLRMAAARELFESPYWWSRFALEAAIGQSLAAAAADAARAGEAFAYAERIAATRQLRPPRKKAIEGDIALRKLRHMAARERLGDDEIVSILSAVQAVEDAVRVFPYSPRRWADAGAAREAAGAIRERAGFGVDDDPREFYQRALDVNEALALDPLAQLSDREVAAIRAAIERLGGPLGASDSL
ncbi:MAG: hypothetical protein GC172_06805 [Phycisphaera sp.]|nr:hypothetical protein [Phycisphaera sp.]